LQKLKENNIEKIDFLKTDCEGGQQRLGNINFNTAIFTNLSRDHLDYHKTFKDYLNSKLILFNKLLKNKGNIIFDEEIPQARLLNNISKKRKLNKYSLCNKKSFIKIINIKKINDQKKVEFLINKKSYSFKTSLIGKIQIKNLIFAIVAAYLSNLKIKDILKSIEKIKPINGRLEKIGNIKNKSQVILDYAHTPDALKTVLENLKDQFPNKKISLVFGCGGDRDKTKRFLMGKIADRFCDKIYITDDNPRTENPKLIRAEIRRGIKNIKSKNVLDISDRKIAIKNAILNLESSEILLVAGKGHETTQIYEKKIRFFSDRDIILSSIKNKNKDLSKNIKLNIIKEVSKSKISLKNLKVKKAVINNRKIKKNDIFLCDSGGQYKYGTTDVTRTVCFKKPSEKIKNIFTRVLKGHIAVATHNLNNIRKGYLIDKKARAALNKINLDYGHGTGHGVGFFSNVHEGPQAISKFNSVELKEGMIVSNEPGYYLEGKFGIRIENLVYIEKKNNKLKFKNLTMAPIDKDLINENLLTSNEKKYLINYNLEIYNNISKFLDKNERTWLLNSIQ